MPPREYIRSWFEGRSEPVRLGIGLFSKDRRRRGYFEEDEYSPVKDECGPEIPLESSRRRRNRYPMHAGYIHQSGRSGGRFDIEDEYLVDDGGYGTGYEPGYLEQQSPRQSYPWEPMRGHSYDLDEDFGYAEGRPAGDPRHDRAHGFESGRSFHGGEHYSGGIRYHHDTFDGYIGSPDCPYGDNDTNNHVFGYYTSEYDWIPEHPTHDGGSRRHHEHPQHDRLGGSQGGGYHSPDYEFRDADEDIPSCPGFGGRYGGRRRRPPRGASAGHPAGLNTGRIRLGNDTIVPSNCYELVGGLPTMDQEELNRAIKLARAKVHPDKLKKPGMSAEEEKEIDDASTAVAQAAEILKDPMVRALYDAQHGR